MLFPLVVYPLDMATDLFLELHCYECHSDGVAKGGLDFDNLGRDFDNVATFSSWEQIYDRALTGEMPPSKVKKRPTTSELKAFRSDLRPRLIQAHTLRKSTVLRRLNRIEYQNTMNDLFGTSLELVDYLPEDGRSHEFDNVGAALGISMQHMQMYLKAADVVLDSAIAKTTEAPQPTTVIGRYIDDKGAQKFIGDQWLKLKDDTIVRFQRTGYPSGMIRTANTRKPGFYRIRVKGFAYQSTKPLTFSVGALTFKRGVKQPVFGYFSMPPGGPGDLHTVELTAFIGANYMVSIEPYGIHDPDLGRRRKEGIPIATVKKPGLGIHSVEVTGPLFDEFPSRGHKLIFDGVERTEITPKNPKDRLNSWYRPKFEVKTDNEKEAIIASLRRVAEAAFRRPVKAGEVLSYVRLHEVERAKGEDFETSLCTAIVALLSSPSFLYLRENQGTLDDFAIASRLSYFLTRSAPDRQLLFLARQGKLKANLRSQTERLIEHSHFERFITDFTDAWLNLREMDFTAPDRTLYPEFEPYLRFSMPLETRAFFRELLEGNHPVSNIVDSHFALLNDRMAEHYRIPGVQGSNFRKVHLPSDSLRGGFLSQASIHKVSANGTNTSPVVRGVYVLERILGITPSPPPPGTPGVEPDIRGASSLRELLDKHRDLESCASCHNKIDPLGFALESFDVIGLHRERFRNQDPNAERVKDVVRGRKVQYRLGPNVDSSGQFIDGTEYQDFLGYKTHLSSLQEDLARAFAKKLLTFATGRELGFSDRGEIERIVTQSAKNEYRLRELLHLVIGSKIFLNK